MLMARINDEMQQIPLTMKFRTAERLTKGEHVILNARGVLIRATGAARHVWKEKGWVFAGTTVRACDLNQMAEIIPSAELLSCAGVHLLELCRECE
jgi:hypothetical protein